MSPTKNPKTPKSNPRSFFDLAPPELEELMQSWSQPAFRVAQVLEWAYQHGVQTYSEMTNLPAMLRERLASELPLYESTVSVERKSNDGTIKLLLRWQDTATSECVLIPSAERRTACISTQVGCPVECVFCASGLGGLERQLTRGQIVEQAMRVRALCADGPRLSNVVFMGLGEPLANYEATVGAVRTINADWGLNIGARKITVSTVGLPQPMRRLADENLQITLALSLHAPTDALRGKIIPWAKRVDISTLVDACRYYFEKTRREVTLEYILLAGINDGEAHAKQLARVAGSMRANINILAYNPVATLPFMRPSEQTVRNFLQTLEQRGANAHIRKSRGRDIEAACGQLRRADKE